MPYNMRPTVYQTLRDFYDDDQERLTSREADYGVHWRLTGSTDPWRVSYVRNTGEIYAMRQRVNTTHHADRRYASGPVIILGVIQPDPVAPDDLRSIYYATLDDIVRGWPEHCGPPGGLSWIAHRIRQGQARLNKEPTERTRPDPRSQ